ncbi:hypothetical protein SSP35_01_01820 [Streptomyces sp. NBRC 110611]|uniref:ATP-binding protein n=1 Tax=Streptomyces sp. NBRC 110611 TaxID=1621259 RepID=UPI000856D82E|nr:ATP-binding protein [Streptomyces sp. NBRC 110611]GAU64846.1 hypothetical protein SSP35_01_01820 [Streptomyces sp. NBRC 110611]
MSTRARPAAKRLAFAQQPASTHHFPSDYRSVRRAREALRHQLGIWHVIGELACLAELLVSELVTNAVKAQVPPAPEIGVRFTLTDGRLRLEVHDSSDELPMMNQAEEDEECGRGLLLVDVLASGWGVDRDDTGKTVWAELAVGGGSQPGRPTPGQNRP